MHTPIFFTSTEDRSLFVIDPPPPIATKEIIETELSFWLLEKLLFVTSKSEILIQAGSTDKAMFWQAKCMTLIPSSIVNC